MTTTQPTRPLRRRAAQGITLVILAMVLGIVALSVVTDPPASRALSSVPADGATVAQAPAAVTVVFSEDVPAGDAQLTVGPAGGGAAVSRGGPVLDGAELRVPVDITAHGEYQATYRVALAGGDVATGTIRFTVGRHDAPGAAAAPGAHDHGSRDPWNVGLLVLDLVLVAAALVMLFRRPRRFAAPRAPWRLDQSGDDQS